MSLPSAAVASSSSTGVNRDLVAWVDSVAQRTRPGIVHWCTGQDDESDRLAELMMRDGTLQALDPIRHPRSYIARTAVLEGGAGPVRRFVCCRNEADAGPSNAWSDPVFVREQLDRLFDGCMQGRVMYVVPYLLGPPGSPVSQAGVQVTDSPLVASKLRIMACVGTQATDQLARQRDFVKCIHSTGNGDPAHRYVCHFPEDQLVVSFGTHDGSDAVLTQRSHALTLASAAGRNEGWMAENMAVVGVRSPDGVTTWLGVISPPGCGRTSLAMLEPKAEELGSGWRIETLSNSAAWLWVDRLGQLRAVNPESGFDLPTHGLSMQSNPNALLTMRSGAIFSNVALRPDRTVWWEGMDGPVPDSCTDWAGQRWTPESPTGAAHPQSSFQSHASQCPTLSEQSSDRDGVPISAILLGSRRSTTLPLIMESFDWQHGVWLGATLTAEKQTPPGEPSRTGIDPMGMMRWCGYHLADHWQQWLDLGEQAEHPPRIFQYNWFRQNADGGYLWPGYAENLRVLKWVVDRVRGRGDAVETPAGMLPTTQALELQGLDWPKEAISTLLAVDCDEWYKEVDYREEFLARFSARLPRELQAQTQALRKRIDHAHLRPR